MDVSVRWDESEAGLLRAQRLKRGPGMADMPGDLFGAASSATTRASTAARKAGVRGPMLAQP